MCSPAKSRGVLQPRSTRSGYRDAARAARGRPWERRPARRHRWLLAWFDHTISGPPLPGVAATSGGDRQPVTCNWRGLAKLLSQNLEGNVLGSHRGAHRHPAARHLDVAAAGLPALGASQPPLEHRHRIGVGWDTILHTVSPQSALRRRAREPWDWPSLARRGWPQCRRGCCSTARRFCARGVGATGSVSGDV